MWCTGAFQVVVDAEDSFLVEAAEQRAVEGWADESCAKGFSTMTQAPVRAARLGQLLQTNPTARRDGQVVRRELCGTELLRMAWNVAGFW